MGEWAGELHVGQMMRDGTRLCSTDPDGEDALAVHLFQNHDGDVARAVEPEALNLDLDEHGELRTARRV